MSSSKQKQKQKQQIRTQLISSLTNLGLQQQLKKQLRIQICQKLKQKDLIKKQETHQDKLYNRIVASLVSQLLVKNDCGYSNSIYVAQSGFDMKTLNRSQIVEIMGMKMQDFDDKLSVLQTLIKKRYPFSGGTFRTVSIQTNPEEVGYTLQQRLTLIDQQYRKNMTNPPPHKQQAEFKRKFQQLEYNLKRNYERDIERFKQFEAHNIKVKVSQQWRKIFEEYSRKISDEYAKKLDHLRKRERLLEDDMINKNKVLDEKVNGSHKTFLQKIDVLDIKTSTVEQTKKNLQIERKRVQEEYKKQQRSLKQKIREYDNLLLNLNSKIQYQVGVAKLAIEQQYQEKNAEFLARKKFIDQEYGKLMGIKDSTDLIKQQSKRLFEENMRLRKDLTQLEKQLRVSVSESASKGERLDSLRGQIFKVQKQAKQKQEALKDLSRNYERRQQQIIQMRKQLDELREWRQKNQQRSQSIINISQVQEGKKTVKISDQPRSQLQIKMDALKKERKKQIEKLKLQLLS